MRTVRVYTFGCQMNKLDSALIISSLERAGFCMTESPDDADVVLLNTCSVRQHAEDRVLSHLGHLKHIRESRPDLVVGVIGCMAQRLGDKLLQHPAVDLVCGPAQIHQIADLLTKAANEKRKVLAIAKDIRQESVNTQQSLETFEAAYSSEHAELPGQAFVRVMHGCNRFCTYCVVPYVRGPEVCRPPQAIIDQIQKLADSGVKQVTLLGQTVNSYRYKSGDKTYCLADLLYMASDINGIEWLKFVTSYPAEEFFNEIIHAMADLPKACPYLHIPAQSGSDRVLRAMNRHYTAAKYLDLLARARTLVSDIAIAGDFIVGFPGETDQDFEATCQLLEKAQYKNSFIFKYSPRPGTAADKRLQDDVPAQTKQERIVRLLALQEEISDRLNKAFLSRQVKVLVEGPSKKSHVNRADSGQTPQLVGRTSTDRIVVFNGPEFLTGRFAQVRIVQTTALTLFGELAD